MQHNPALDGLRALSVLAVVFFHCNVPGAGGGFAGLDMFFVISGYLITSMLAGEYRHGGGIEVGRFYARRALRLYPTLLLMLAAYIGLAPLVWPTENRWMMASLSAFYVMDYAMAFTTTLPPTVAHTWSLGVEEKFYLLWPLLLPVLLRTRRPVAWLLAAFIVLTTWRCFVAFNWRWQQAYFSFDTRMTGILLGAIAALARPRMSGLSLAVACAALAFAVALPFMPSLPFHRNTEAVTLSITLAELCAFVLVCHAAQRPTGGFIASRPMVYIGRLSYGIFIWHFPLAFTLRTLEMPTWITLACAIGFAFPMAALCLHLVDMPIKRWRERTWTPARQGSAT